MAKFLDLAGLTAYDRKLKEWFKAGVVDIAEEAIRELFVTVSEGPADNEIWYTTTDGNKMVCGKREPRWEEDEDAPYVTYVLGEPGYETVNGYTIISHEYNEEKQCFIITCDSPITSTFWGCGDFDYSSDSKIETCWLPNKLTTLNSWCFARCYYLNTLYLPSSISVIKDYVLYNNNSFIVNFDGTKHQWDSIQKNDDFWNKHADPITVHCTDGQVAL